MEKQTNRHTKDQIKEYPLSKRNMQEENKLIQVGQERLLLVIGTFGSAVHTNFVHTHAF